MDHGEHGGHREKRWRQHRRHHEIVCGMVFDGMIISTQDIAEANRLAEETPLPAESFPKKDADRSRYLSSEKRRSNESFQDATPQPKASDLVAATIIQRFHSRRATPAKASGSIGATAFQRNISRRETSAEGSDVIGRRTNQPRPLTQAIDRAPIARSNSSRERPD